MLQVSLVMNLSLVEDGTGGGYKGESGNEVEDRERKCTINLWCGYANLGWVLLLWTFCSSPLRSLNILYCNCLFFFF